MPSSTKYSVFSFIKDAKAVLETDAPLEEKKADIADRMSVLTRRDDLTRFAIPIGPADGSTMNYLLYAEKPHLLLGISQFDPHYYSPVHEHGDYWVIGAGWRGCDRWDMFERLDDGSVEGYADVRLVDQIMLPPGATVWMPPPPRAIHSHNNETGGFNYELIFTAAKPMLPKDRLFYDVEEKMCWPSIFAPSGIYPENQWPPTLPGHHYDRAPIHDLSCHDEPCRHEAGRHDEKAQMNLAASREHGQRADPLRHRLAKLARKISCPVCNLMTASRQLLWAK